MGEKGCRAVLTFTQHACTPVQANHQPLGLGILNVLRITYRVGSHPSPATCLFRDSVNQWALLGLGLAHSF